MRYLACLLLVLAGACYADKPQYEEFTCTLFLTDQIPEAEDFPAYLACWSDRGRVVYLWWHQVRDQLDALTQEDIDQYGLPNEWFDDETGAFLPEAFWEPELELDHQYDGEHDPCVYPDLVFLAELDCEDE